MSIRSLISQQKRGGLCVLCVGEVMCIRRDILHIWRFVEFLQKNDVIMSVKNVVRATLTSGI